MTEPGVRVAQWLGVLGDLLQEPLTAMPHGRVLEALHRTFDIGAVSWNWRDADGRFGMTLRPAHVLDSEATTMAEWNTGRLHDCHPLLTWYAITRDHRPQTIARVPTRIVPANRRIVVEAPLRRLGLEQQLVMNYRMHETMHRAYVLARPGSDFTSDDLVLAGYVQRSLTALDHQVRLLDRLVADGGDLSPAADLELTGRELAVLRLVAAGLSTREIGHRLTASPRTVEKHLERAYRKLGVQDRVNALRVARLSGALPRA